MIKREPRIKTLATNPLMLTIIALVHRIEAELPHERVKLYDKCVTALVQTWEEVRGLRVEDRQRIYYKYRRRLLEQLAYWMHSQPGERGRAREVKEGNLEFQIRRFLLEDPKLSLDNETAHQEAHDFVNLVKGRTGLLIERGEGVYAFPHLTFQEYLAAADIEYRLADSIDAMWAEIQPRLFDPHWREVILLLLGSLNKFEQHPTELVRRIFESTDEYEPVLHRNLYLATRALADRVEVEAKLRRKIIDQLLSLVIGPEWLTFNDALTAISLLQGDDYAAGRLLAIAQDSRIDQEIRCESAQTLAQLGQTDEAAQVLLALVKDSHNIVGWVRSDAVEALGQLGQINESVIRDLLTLAQEPKMDSEDQLGIQATIESEIRYSAIQALAQLGYSAGSMQVLLAIAQDPLEPDRLRCIAAEALGQHGYSDEAAQLLLALTQDPQTDEQVKLASVETLGRLGYNTDAAQLLLGIVQNPQMKEYIRRDAAESLGQFGQTDDAVLHGLLTLIKDPHETEVMRDSVAKALGKLGQAHEFVLENLFDLLQDSEMDVAVRHAAAQAIGQLGWADKNILEGLLNIAQDSQVDAWARSGSVRALGQLGQTDKTCY